MSEFRVRTTISYDGTEFCGWQKQRHEGRPSIQETLENALSKVFHTPITCVASGRTDAGVHALNQTVHFNAPRNPEGINLKMAMKSLLPPTIVMKKTWLAPPDFHSLFSATGKTYRYWIWTGPTPPALLGRFSHWYPHHLELDHLNEVSHHYKGTHDFKSFQSRGTEIENTIRTIYRAEWHFKRANLLEFRITGNGFLKQMVRNLVGTQLLMEKDSLPPDYILGILDKKDRKSAGWTAPPHGLFLSKVYYPRELDKKCLEL